MIFVIALILSFGFELSLKVVFLISMTITGLYQHIVAKIYGLVLMPPMD
jgi:hypothetical protein